MFMIKWNIENTLFENVDDEQLANREKHIEEGREGEKERERSCDREKEEGVLLWTLKLNTSMQILQAEFKGE